jgi:Tfp pilus assembly protein PilF
VWLEKIPLFALSFLFGLLTIKYQDNVKAIAEAGMYPFWQKIVFSFYGFGEYIKRFFWPFPLSAIHPFPGSGVVPVAYFPSIIIGIASLIATWYWRKKKYILFGIGFYAVNVALVLQLLTFGHAIISERYTYVPYIGLSFLIAMVWAKSTWPEMAKKGVLFALLLACIGFAVSSFQQVQVWKNGGTLWSNAIETYPDSYIARSNRGQYLSSKLAKYDEALADYAIALQVTPNDSFSLINRATIYINQQNFAAAYADADSLVRHYPNIAKGHLFRGISGFRLGNADQAYTDLTNCIQLDPNAEEAWSFRGVVSYNSRQDYTAAKADFDRAVELSPKKGLNYKNRARCWIKFGNKAEALKDLETARQLGEQVGDDLIQAAQALQ